MCDGLNDNINLKLHAFLPQSNKLCSVLFQTECDGTRAAVRIYTVESETRGKLFEMLEMFHAQSTCKPVD